MNKYLAPGEKPAGIFKNGYQDIKTKVVYAAEGNDKEPHAATHLVINGKKYIMLSTSLVWKRNRSGGNKSE